MNTIKLPWPQKVSASSRLELLSSGLRCMPASGAALVELPTPETAKKPSFWKRDMLTGDRGGPRSALKEKYGTEVTVNYIGEAFSVLSEGLNRLRNYQGKLEFSLYSDLQKRRGCKGGTRKLG